MHPATDNTPAAALRRDLLALAEDLARNGRGSESRLLRERVESWWTEQQAWLEGVRQVLGVHHEISNALVGVSGNVQLLLMGPVSQQGPVKERLQVVLREAERIKDASVRLRELRGSLTAEPPRRAA